MTDLNPSLGVFGFPKSGNNLANKIVNSIFQASDQGLKVHDIHVHLNRGTFIPPHPSLGYTVYKSHSAAPFNGSLNPHEGKAEAIGVGKTRKAILITRNPIDVLFSFINFRRLQVKKNKDIFGQSEFIKTYLGLSGKEDYKFFVGNATYENLRDRGCLRSAFHAYSVNGLSIPDLYRISGAWPSHLLSWMNGEYSPNRFLRIRYEDIFNAPDVVANAIADFLSIESSVVLDAISHVNSSAIAKADRKASVDEAAASQVKPSFINKIKPYYSLQYIDKRLVSSFVARYHGLLKVCGYGDFLDLLLEG